MNQLVNRLRRPGTIVWAVLMAATGASWLLGTQHGDLASSTRLATVGVLVIAFVKVRLVGMHFMELRHAPRALMLLFNAWVVIVCSVLVGLYLTGLAAT